MWKSTTFILYQMRNEKIESRFSRTCRYVIPSKHFCNNSQNSYNYSLFYCNISTIIGNRKFTSTSSKIAESNDTRHTRRFRTIMYIIHLYIGIAYIIIYYVFLYVVVANQYKTQFTLQR